MLKSVGIMLAITAYHDYEIWKMNVKISFLNGKFFEDVYMTQVEGFITLGDARKVPVRQLGFTKNEYEPYVYKTTYYLSKMIFLPYKMLRNDRLLRCFNMHKSKKGLLLMSHDVLYALSMMSKYQSNPRKTSSKWLLDASFQTNKDDFRSHFIFMFCLNGGFVSWKSSKQEIVTNSTIDVEKGESGNPLLSLEDLIDLYCDNNKEIAQAKEPRSHQQSKHILRLFHLIREIIDKEDVKICKVLIVDNVVNPLTKPLAQ
ncbi:hypothetical protein CR513_14210, partial [Mucuna pruriens]